MKPEYEKILAPLKRSFMVKVISRPSRPLLSQAWHYHPELEICFTEKSIGKRFVGNQISDYSEGDLVMFGANLPHGFTTEQPCLQVVIQMTYDFLGAIFMDKPEMRGLKSLFDRSARGLDFGVNTKAEAYSKIKQLKNAEGFEQLIYLLELLYLLAKDEEVKPICSEEYALAMDANHLDRLKVVYDYILINLKNDLSVKQAAAEINLTEAAFFKFIRKHTKKTFTQIVNEIRINHASKLLISTEKPITEICYECGYNNISYFNRKFKAVLGKTPRDFKNDYV
ncbi:MAG: AraC family transcriptional regulator [Chitinophagales bacterium]